MIWPSSPTSAVSYTHAETVKLPVNCSAAGFPRSTNDVEPSKESPVPFRPGAQVVLTRVPVMSEPEWSAVVVPVPSLNEYAATNPGAAFICNEDQRIAAVTTASAGMAFQTLPPGNVLKRSLTLRR